MSISVKRNDAFVLGLPSPHAPPPSAEATRAMPTRDGELSSSRAARYVFVATCLAFLAYGWFLASSETFTPKEGAGYWLGIAGGTMLLVQLAYPVRKRVKFMRRTGSAPAWFRMHMILGIIGPIIILWHSNFSLGATNSNVTLFAMLLVAVSGIAGRYFYGKIHRNLYGARADAGELLADATALLRDVEADVGGSGGSVAKALADFGVKVIAPRTSLAASLAHALWIAVATPFVRARLMSKVSAAIRGNAGRLGWTRRERAQHYRAARLHIDGYLQAVTKASGLAFYERLFAMWHIFHMPLFCLLIVTGIVHVVAVHLY